MFIMQPHLGCVAPLIHLTVLLLDAVDSLDNPDRGQQTQTKRKSSIS